MFDEHLYEHGLYTLTHYLFDRMVENIRRYGALSAVDSSLYEYFNLHNQ